MYLPFPAHIGLWQLQLITNLLILPGFMEENNGNPKKCLKEPGPTSPPWDSERAWSETHPRSLWNTGSLSVSSWKVGADSSAFLVGSQSVRILVPAKSWVARAFLIASSCVTGFGTAYTTCLVQEGKNIKGSSLLPVWKRQSMEARQSLLFSLLSSSQIQSLVATWFLLFRTRRSLLWAIETYLES